MNYAERKMDEIADMIETILTTWNRENNDVQNRVQLLKELVDKIAEYRYAKMNLDYSHEPIKFNIFVTNKRDLIKDVRETEKNSTGREIFIFEEDLRQSYEISVLMTKFVAKLFLAISKGLKNYKDYYILDDLPDCPTTDAQLQRIYRIFDKEGRVKIAH